VTKAVENAGAPAQTAPKAVEGAAAATDVVTKAVEKAGATSETVTKVVEGAGAAAPTVTQTVESVGAAAEVAPKVTPADPVSIFWITLVLFGFFIAYFTAEKASPRRIFATLLTVGVSAFCAFFYFSLGMPKGIDLQGGTQFLLEDSGGQGQDHQRGGSRGRHRYSPEAA